MTNRSAPSAGDATGALVTWLVTGAVGPALVALPVNWAADKIASAAVRWFRRLRKTDDLSRLVKAVIMPRAGLSRNIAVFVAEDCRWPEGSPAGRGTLSCARRRVVACRSIFT